MIRLGLVQMAVADDVSWWRLTMREELLNAGLGGVLDFGNCFFLCEKFLLYLCLMEILEFGIFELDAAYSHIGGRRSLSILSSKLEMK
jgi:hypothetical protein